MKHFLPPPVTPSGEEPIAAGGRQQFGELGLAEALAAQSDDEEISFFTTAHDAVGSEEPIGMGGW
jgi:hypothetical protein